MTVNFEVKGMLARLLATEGLIVEHKKVETACFNVHTRVLTLPMWQKATNVVYDMLVAHEVSHALYTPDEDYTKKVKVPHQFMNVCEDVRVEKLIKRRYAGLAKTFYGGYKQFQKDDFFQIGNADISKYNLADRANLYFKIGNFLSIKFTKKEQEIIDIIGDAETFDETLNAAKILYEYCKQNRKESPEPESADKYEQNSASQEFFFEEDEDDEDSSLEEGDEDFSFEDDEDSSFEEGDEDSSPEEGEDDDKGGEHAEPDVETMSSLEENLKELLNNNAQENNYIEVPKLNLDSVIVSNQIIHDLCKQTWDNQIFSGDDCKIFTAVDAEYVNFKRSAQIEVNYLVKEFECRKAADSYARALVSKTGVLDCTKLHTYKYQEDLFKKVTTFATGKNHGLIFILDWSGSMSKVLMDTIKQLYNLIWFCSKVNIPFEVYAFTNDWTYKHDCKPGTSREHTVHKENELVVDYKFNLLNLFTSRVKSSVLDNQLKNIYRVAKKHDGYSYSDSGYYPPNKLGLSGTPLNESLIALHQILPHFQKEYKLQKVQCVVLTDGESSGMKHYRRIKRHWEKESIMSTSHISTNSYLRDRKTGNVYKFYENNFDCTDLLLKNLRDNFPSVNFIGMRIIDGRDVKRFIRKYTGHTENDEYLKIMIRWKKERSFSINTSGYHTYFGISSSALNSDSEFIVGEDASKAQIKSAFFESLSSKRMNKKILGEFISLVA